MSNPLAEAVAALLGTVFVIAPGGLAASSSVTSMNSTFGLYGPGRIAVSYDESVPVGARGAVRVTSSGNGGTAVNLTVHGLEPNREYGAHVHTERCGPDPADAGPHYQNEVDPVQPSVDPAYANPSNEIWLDFTTDHTGHDSAHAAVNWTFREDEAHSVVIHEHHTATGHGVAGTAGARLGCLTFSMS
ncbi:superoxide dismutase family protein [Allonocardiopsis opalescens]|uniref:Cu-Zn family superoxide dismutase n=1 Tax=Allonocardiopsis opalescens TaxID=1144618 RepID=A0A2T0QAE3_9ACTN|nr:superoxide dismutase family protein [Allonocardiopsis opalescens]PRY00817.1 Cu-Zn family superoxide dismutase [Allonocardiopsis opalescens]